MKISVVATFIWLISCSVLYGQKCVIPSRVTDELTRQGGNMVVTSTEKRRLSRLRGRVEDANAKAQPNALVEIYDNPVGKKDRKPGDQKRLIACEANPDGLFEIDGLPKGDYELRVSVGIGFNVSHVFITIDP